MMYGKEGSPLSESDSNLRTLMQNNACLAVEISERHTTMLAEM